MSGEPRMGIGLRILRIELERAKCTSVPSPVLDRLRVISSDLGGRPTWSPDGDRLYFTAVFDGHLVLMGTELDVEGNSLSVGRATRLIDPWPASTSFPVRSFDIQGDNSFVVRYNPNAIPGQPVSVSLRRQHRVAQLHVVLNFVETLRGRVTN